MISEDASSIATLEEVEFFVTYVLEVKHSEVEVFMMLAKKSV